MALVQAAGAAVSRIDLYPAYMQASIKELGFVIDDLFPPQGVSADAGAFGSVDPSQVTQRLDTRRAPRQPSVEINMSMGNDTFQIVDYGAKEFCDDIEQARYGGQINQEQFAATQCRIVLDRDKEWVGSRLVQNTSLYANAAAVATWLGASGNAIKDVGIGIEAFVKKFGLVPNRLVINFGLKLNLCQSTQIRSALTQVYGRQLPATIPNPDLATVLAGTDVPLEIVVPRGIYNTANPGQAYSGGYIWDNTMAVLTFVAPGGTQSGIPTMGEQLVREEGGMKANITSWRENDPAGTYVKAAAKYQLKMNPNAPVYIITGCA